MSARWATRPAPSIHVPPPLALTFVPGAVTIEGNIRRLERILAEAICTVSRQACMATESANGTRRTISSPNREGVNNGG